MLDYFLFEYHSSFSEKLNGNIRDLIATLGKLGAKKFYKQTVEVKVHKCSMRICTHAIAPMYPIEIRIELSDKELEKINLPFITEFGNSIKELIINEDSYIIRGRISKKDNSALEKIFAVERVISEYLLGSSVSRPIGRQDTILETTIEEDQLESTLEYILSTSANITIEFGELTGMITKTGNFDKCGELSLSAKEMDAKKILNFQTERIKITKIKFSREIFGSEDNLSGEIRLLENIRESPFLDLPVGKVIRFVVPIFKVEALVNKWFNG